MKITIKRVYEVAEKEDGKRILVDRLWPRGLTKEKANLAIWLKEIAPSTELRKWFNHDPEKWQKFKSQYLQELNGNYEHVSILREEIKKSNVALLYGAKDEKYNEAIVLKSFFEK